MHAFLKSCVLEAGPKMSAAGRTFAENMLFEGLDKFANVRADKLADERARAQAGSKRNAEAPPDASSLFGS